MPWKECHVMDERLRFVARLSLRKDIRLGSTPIRHQKSTVTLNRANRGLSTVDGASHVAPLVTGS